MDVQKLLNQFLGAGNRGGYDDRDRDYRGGVDPRRGTGSGGSVVDQIGSMIGGALGGSGGRGGSRGHGSGGSSGLNSAITGALASGLASQLFRGRSMSGLGGTALKLGGAALVAGIAYKAYQSWQANQAGGAGAARGFLPTGSGGAAGSIPLDNGRSLPSPAGTPFLPEGQEEDRARLMLSAMIAAAKADGYVDAEEERAIFGRIDEAGLDAEEKGFVMDEMRRPMSVSELAARATSPEIGAEIYTASLVAIDADHPAEKAYLDRLASALRLPPELVTEIHRATGDAMA